MKYVYLILFLFINITSIAQLKINELMPKNVSAVWDDYYNYSMWIELYNPGETPIYQNDFFLSDNFNEPEKWRLPYKQIGAKEVGIIWMENEERENHAPFKLKPEGGVLYLFFYDGTIIDAVSYPAQFRNISFGRVTDGSDNWTFFEEHSAGSSNNGKESSLIRCNAPRIQQKGGLYPATVFTGFDSPAAGDSIYYTLNSEEPTRDNAVYYQPGSQLVINSNTVVRAKTFSKGKLSSDIITTTYLIGQRDFNLPVVSLVTPAAYLFDNTIGIYVKGTNGITGCGDYSESNWNQDWDRPANFELFDRTKTTVLNQEVDIQTAGCWSRANNPQKSLHIQPKNKFGGNTLAYPIFSSRQNQRYKDITLRNSGNDFRYSMMRDGMMQTLIIGRMDLEYLAYEPAVLFINGEYYGIQNIRERSNADLLYTTHGLKKEDVYRTKTYDIRHDPEYQAMMNYINDNDIQENETYEGLKTMMDTENYMHYMMTHIYVANYDWPHNNVKMWKTTENGIWRWILYDTDFGFNLYIDDLHNFNSLTYALGENWEKETQEWATELFRKLVQNERFKNEFADRFCYHISSTFNTSRVDAIIDSIASMIRDEIAYHKERWITDREFELDLERMKTFSALRPTKMLQFISNRFFEGAAIRQLSISSNISRANYTFNGITISDPSITLNNFHGRNYTLTANKVQGYNFIRWELRSSAESNTSPTLTGVLSGNMELHAVYEEDSTTDPVSTAQVFINEIVASNSIIPDEHGDTDDYVELYNASSSPVSIASWYVSDKQGNPRLWQLPDDASLVIPANGYLLLWADGQPEQGAAHVDFKLSASGEFISLYAENKFGELILIDQLSFPALPTNQAYSRVPDGSANWKIQKPTPLESNSITNIDELITIPVMVYPTRFTERIIIENAEGQKAKIFGLTGEVILEQTITSKVYELNVSQLNAGIYLLQVNQKNFKIIK
jgi:hypothetical protein